MATRTRRQVFRLSLLGLAAIVLSACGQKGPLYLPEESEDEKKKKKEKTSALGRSGFRQA